MSTQSASISIVDGRALVMLKVAGASVAKAASTLELASAGQASAGAVSSLWTAPDQWLLVSDEQAPDAIISRCESALAGTLFNAVNMSSALTVFRLSGEAAREVLTAGCGLDLRESAFGPGRCSRTQFARVAVVIVATADDTFELYVDRSYERYLRDWLQDNVNIIDRIRGPA